ncbi:hypothetical protein WA026_008603 [Henosepilachna vigintioctopunctata]|uniref:MADF domain-containing protein n=1 Tax=Henosepilachna vigintioctopunctata TaxID=420089 RepID=A0AAW1UHU0_9CUCU
MALARVFRFNDDETQKFLELYSKERLLYDSTLLEYRHRNARIAAATRISKEMNISGLGPREVMAKFKNLRNSFSQELKKISDSERTRGTDNVYKPKVFWFDLMNSFIRPFVQQHLVLPVITAEENGQQVSESDNDRDVKEHVEESQPIKLRNTGKTNMHFKREKRRLSQIQSSISKTQKMTDDNDISFKSNSLDRSQEVSHRSLVTTANVDDSFDHFGRYIASMLREIGQPTSVRLQQKIINLIADDLCPPSEEPKSESE